MNPTIDELNELFEYEPASGDLTWKKPRSNSVKPGQLAGTADRYGYLRVRVFNRSFAVHRIAWSMANGSWPDSTSQIDHINGNRSDNRAENLAVVSNSENQMRSSHSAGVSGLRGVSWNSRIGKWKSKIKRNGKEHHLGYFDSKEAAFAAYCSAASKLHGQHMNRQAAEALPSKAVRS